MGVGEWGGKRDGKMIVMWGVEFMGERGKIVCGEKKVLIGELNGGWCLGERCGGEKFGGLVKEDGG